MLDHLLRLHPDDRALRFCGPVDDAHLHEYTETIFDNGGMVLGCISRDALCAVGELHQYHRPGPHQQGPRVAEIAFSVNRGFQGRGIGTAIMHALVDLARDHGFAKLHFACLLNNFRVQKMARRLAGSLVFIDGTVEAEIASSNCAWASRRCFTA